MAGVFFTAGEKKKRAGVYQRYENNGGSTFAGATDGIVAAVISGTWGPLNEVVSVENTAQAVEKFGNAGNAFVINEAFAGGARIVRVVRVGNGGTQANALLKDTSDVEAVRITSKYVGTRAFSYAVRSVMDDATKQEFVLYEGEKVLEKITFAQANGITELINKAKDSQYVNIEVAAESTAGVLATVGETPMTNGTNPTVETSAYSDGLIKLEPYTYNTLCVDSNDTAVHALVAAYMARSYQAGKTGMAVLGEPISVALATRQSNAAAFNDYKVVYVGGGWYDTSDNLIDGYRAAARLAGMIANIPSNQSLTHKVIALADRPAEMLTNTQFETSIDNGMLTFSHAPSGAVWVENGINTLVTLSGEDDEGWKKIKRTKVRFEVMDRINNSIAPLIGTVNNDPDGRAAVIQNAQGVLNAMVAEMKLLAGATVTEDPDNAPAGDSAWFVITADDIDSLEKVYFTYKFRFSTAS